MHQLFINPSEIATRIIPAFKARNLDVGILLTQGKTLETGVNLADLSTINVIDLNKDTWNQDLKIVSAVAWCGQGHAFLESISDQVALSNVAIPGYRDARLNCYLRSPVEENTVFIDTLSYKGRHVVMSVWKYQDSQWKLFQDFKTPEFVNDIELAWSNLDSLGVVNGPSQSYILPSKEIKLRYHPTNAAYGPSRGLVTRHWFDIWPTVVENESKNPKKSHNSFYDWVEKFGSSKRFTTQDA